MEMKNLTIIFPARSNLKAFYDLMNNIISMTKDHKNIETLCAIDLDDEVLMDAKQFLERKFAKANLAIFPRERSEHFTKDYWNFLANKASGRFIVNTALGCEITTQDWDEVVYRKMSNHADKLGDDIVHGLIKDNIRRDGEDKEFPNFSCHPVVSKKHVEALGYLFDERYWAWGCDPVVTLIYNILSQILKQRRIVSLTNVEIIANDSIHTTKETDENKLIVMRELDKGYQHFLRISQEHPYAMTNEEATEEAIKLKNYILKTDIDRSVHGPCGHPKN